MKTTDSKENYVNKREYYRDVYNFYNFEIKYIEDTLPSKIQTIEKDLNYYSQTKDLEEMYLVDCYRGGLQEAKDELASKEHLVIEAERVVSDFMKDCGVENLMIAEHILKIKLDTETT